MVKHLKLLPHQGPSGLFFLPSGAAIIVSIKTIEQHLAQLCGEEAAVTDNLGKIYHLTSRENYRLPVESKPRPYPPPPRSLGWRHAAPPAHHHHYHGDPIAPTWTWLRAAFLHHSHRLFKLEGGASVSLSWNVDCAPTMRRLGLAGEEPSAWLAQKRELACLCQVL